MCGRYSVVALEDDYHLSVTMRCGTVTFPVETVSVRPVATTLEDRVSRISTVAINKLSRECQCRPYNALTYSSTRATVYFHVYT